MVMAKLCKGAKIAAAMALIYMGSTYAANSYFKNKELGKEFPSAATIEQIAEDAGNMMKETGKYASKMMEYGLRSGKELTGTINEYVTVYGKCIERHSD